MAATWVARCPLSPSCSWLNMRRNYLQRSTIVMKFNNNRARVVVIAVRISLFHVAMNIKLY